MARPRVFLTQQVLMRTADGKGFQAKFDLSTAEMYGDIIPLIEHGQSMFSVVPIMRQLRERLAGFTKDDYLLPIGDPSIMMAAGIIAAEKTGGLVRVLKWDRRQGVYIPLSLDTSGKAQ